MGNMDSYINLSVRAHGAGGPDQLLQQVFRDGRSRGQAEGLAKGIIVGSVVVGGFAVAAFWPTLSERFGARHADDISDATADAIAKAVERKWCTVTEARDFDGGLSLAFGDRFRALTRSGGIVQIQVENVDEAYYAPSSEIEAISDFVLDEMDEL